VNYAAMSDDAIMTEAGSRIARERLNRNVTQNDLAAKAGVARKVVQAVEAGRGCSLENMIRILRALNRLDQLDSFLPEAELSPLQLAKLRGRERVRATGRRGRLAQRG